MAAQPQLKIEVHKLYRKGEIYTLRSLEPHDATGDWGSWLDDADTTALLNARARTLTETDLENYIRRYDGVTSFLFGIFENESGAMLGIWTGDLSPDRKKFVLNVLVGRKGARRQSAVSGTKHLVYDFFYNELGCETAIAPVLSTNQFMIDWLLRHGWVEKRRKQVPAASGVGTCEVVHLEKTKQAWLLDRD